MKEHEYNNGYKNRQNVIVKYKNDSKSHRRIFLANLQPEAII